MRAKGEAMTVRIERIAKEKCVLRSQTRKHDPDYLIRLAESLAKGQLQPIGLLKDFTVIWGHARVLAARMKPEITHLTAAIFDEPVSERAWQQMRFVENQLRQDLSNAEKCQNCIDYAKSEPSLTLKQIAADLGVDPSLVTRWMAWEKCIEEVRQALATDKITLNEMYSISQLPPDQQAQELNGSSATRRNGVKTSKVKCQMPSGVVVTLAGDGIGMESVIDTLTELLKSAKKASSEGLDAKTWEKVLKDKAKV